MKNNKPERSIARLRYHVRAKPYFFASRLPSIYTRHSRAQDYFGVLLVGTPITTLVPGGYQNGALSKKCRTVIRYYTQLITIVNSPNDTIQAMVFNTPTELLPTAFPASLSPLLHIPQPPKSLWVEGALPADNLTLLTVVGSRNYTSYGKQVVEELIAGLTGYPIGIVSGLALGIDGLAHEAALRHHLYTLAVPGSGLGDSTLYPASHRTLARRIIEGGGGLLSELPPTAAAALWTFPQRNRIMAGLARATLLIEASEKSGTLITARMAVDYNRELLVVPGSIFAKNSHGVHQFLKLGAIPVTSSEDILIAIGLEPEGRVATLHPDLSPQETRVIELLREPQDRDTLIRLLELPTGEAITLLMLMELKGVIMSEMNIYRTTQ